MNNKGGLYNNNYLCKICHNTNNNNNSDNDISIFISPCLCSGTIKWVHEKCLIEYIKESNNPKLEGKK